MLDRLRLEGGDIFLRLLQMRDAPAVWRFYTQNRAFLEAWEPRRGENFFTLKFIQSLVESSIENARLDSAYSFGIFLNNAQAPLIGRLNLSGVTRGISQTANLGYALDERYNGRGYTTTAVRRIVRFAFKDLELHRLAAATLLHNQASMRVLEKAGFRREGLARHYLQINGQWQDHYLFATTVEDLYPST